LVIAQVQAQALSPLDFDRKSTGEKSALIREKLEEKAKLPQTALANQRHQAGRGGVLRYRHRHCSVGRRGVSPQLRKSAFAFMPLFAS
jgi:hypothetical protein